MGHTTPAHLSSSERHRMEFIIVTRCKIQFGILVWLSCVDKKAACNTIIHHSVWSPKTKPQSTNPQLWSVTSTLLSASAVNVAL